MGDCGKILSLNRSFSETDIGCRSTVLSSISRGPSSETLPIAKFIDQKKILDSILNSSSSSGSSQISLQEFQDFAFNSGIFQIQKKRALFGRKKRKSKRVKHKKKKKKKQKKQKRVQFCDCVVPKIEKSPSSTIVMHCRSYGRPTVGPRYYVQEGYKSRMQRKDHRPQCSYIPCNYVDPSPKYLQKNSRSISPNLPKLSYLEKNHCQQYQPSPNYYCQQPQARQRLVFKNQPYQPYQPTRIQDLSQSSSKKSIPQHALMRNLLSGLSIFDDEERSRGLSQRDSSIHRYKSMGNINNYCKANLELKPSIKSSLDFSDLRNYNDEDFREYCRNYAKESISKLQASEETYYVPENYFAPKSCTDRNCPFNCERNIGDGLFFKPSYTATAHVEEERVLPPTRRNIVQERKQFFENKGKDIKEDCRNGPSKSPKIFHLPAEKEKPDDEESVTELYRNAHTLSSTTSITRSKNSRCASKPIELFHPEYNFDQRSSSTDMRQSIIESIRMKIFRVAEPSFHEEDEYVLNTPKCPKFPKETRKAVSMIINQKKHQCKCSRNKKLTNVETQTSPVSSKPSLADDDGMPCTKNLLCGKGYHSGRCGDEVSRRMERICMDDCFCRRDQYMLDGLRTVLWSGRTKRDFVQEREDVRLEVLREDKVDDYEGFGGEEESCMDSRDETIGGYGAVGEYCFDIPEESESFLQYIRPDRESSSEENERYAERVSYEVTSSEVIHRSSSSSSTDMNGLNGHANGDLNGCGDIITQNQQRGCWTIGLINSKYRYLTAETFGFKINANGTSLKKKQIWTLEPDTTSGAESFIYLKSHLDKYLAVDSFGNVTCESEEKDPGSKFQISVSEDGKGRWAFRNVVRGYFLGSSSDKLTCTAKVPGDAEFWYIHLAARPQVNLRSVGRKRFAHLSENLDEIHVDANIPWGEDTLFTLEFHADEDGKYALHTCNNKYLSAGGKLIETCNKDCLFSAEYHSGQLALRDRSGQYLSPIGSKAVLKTRSNTVTKDELFSLEDSLPQASFVAALNARYVSVKQGVDVTANQDEISDHETFQLEFDWSTKRWYIRTMQDRYWTLETGGGIQASGDKRSSNALFDLVWQNDGSLAFRANNGRYVITKRSGHLYATSDVIDDNCKYYFYLINRPILVLKCEQGFVGYKSSSSPKLECNKASYECIQVERAEKGVIYFKGQTGKYWHVDSEGVTADSDAPEGFYLELREPTRLCIKNSNGNYITASKNGVFRLGDTSIEHATQWEY